MHLIGFTFIRNGITYDYPFLESIQSLAALCDSVVVVVGKSDDDTRNAIERLHLANLHIHDSIWDDSLREGGKVLSQQTNIALDIARSINKKAWGIYLQGDEVLNEQDFALIRQDIQKASNAKADALKFRYFHFWQRYDQIAIAKRWYPQEIRAIDLSQDIHSFGDAQSFSGAKKIYTTNAFVYHYGHVRKKEAYERKKEDFHRLWHDDTKVQSVIDRAKIEDQNEITLRYLGPHPKVMQKKVPSPSKTDEVIVYAKNGILPPAIESKIQANTVRVTANVREYLASPLPKACYDSLSFWQKIQCFSLRRSMVPNKMQSPQALPWSQETIFMLRLSEAGIAFY